MPAPRRVFNNPEPLTRERAVAVLQGDDPAAMAEALVAIALHEPDWRWVQSECTRLSTHRDPNLRRLSALCLGHVARLHRVLDRPAAEAVLRRLVMDPDRWVRGEVETVIDDLEIFLRWRPAIDVVPPAV